MRENGKWKETVFGNDEYSETHGANIAFDAEGGLHTCYSFKALTNNRWAMKAELGVIVPLHPKWLLEAGLGGWFFEDNDDFFNGRNREQDPVYALQAHLIRTFNSGMWLSLDGNYYEGGRSTVDDRQLDDLQRDSKLGLTLHYPLRRKDVVKIGYTLGSVNDSDENFNVLVFTYSRIF